MGGMPSPWSETHPVNPTSTGNYILLQGCLPGYGDPGPRRFGNQKRSAGTCEEAQVCGRGGGEKWG